MKKNLIAKVAKDIKTKDDLLHLLNRMKGAEMAKNGYSDFFRPFTMRQITHYRNPNHAFHRFSQFKIPKKKAGEFRTITTPRNKTYMLLLHYVNEIFKAMYTPTAYAMGFTEGRSIVDNADTHRNQNYVLNIDLKDFFTSIEQRRLLKRIQVKPFCFSKEAALLLSGFCFMKENRDVNGEKKAFYVLPQGSPASPIITNMICDRLDHLLAGLAKRFNLNYSRYADDITFSSMHNVYQKNGAFWTELKRIIADQGFTFNDDKTRLQKKGSRQEVTGIIVSDKLNVTQKYVRNIRNILYIWDRYSYGDAMRAFLPRYKADKGLTKKGDPDLVNVLEGKLLYLKMVKGSEDSVYLRLNAKFEKLVSKTFTKQNTTEKGITYLETLTVDTFEKLYKTILTINRKDDINHAYFKLDGKTVHVSVNKPIKKQEISKDILSISHCRNINGEMFWLLHKSDKILVHTPKPLDIDELNKELDALLNIENG